MNTDPYYCAAIPCREGKNMLTAETQRARRKTLNHKDTKITKVPEVAHVR